MKRTVFLLLFFWTGSLLSAQKTFELVEGDTTYVMQEFYVVYLVAGDNRNHDSLETIRIQQEHLAHLEKMSVEGHLSLVGPFGDEGDVRGMCIYNTPNLEKAIELASADPAVKAGRLKVEGRPWWCSKGGALK